MQLPSPARDVAAPTRVLLIDDDTAGRFLIERILRAASHHFIVDTAGSFEEALAEVATRRHQVYLVDQRIGAGNGVELIRRVMDGTPAGPLILLTGHGDVEVDAAAMQAGAVEYLTKEALTPELLSRTIRYAIETWRVRSELRLQEDRYRGLFEGAPVGLFRTDAFGRLTEANPALARMMGFDEPWQLVGRPAVDFYLDPADYSHVLSLLGGGHREMAEDDILLRRVDGSIFWGRLSLRRVGEAMAGWRAACPTSPNAARLRSRFEPAPSGKRRWSSWARRPSAPPSGTRCWRRGYGPRSEGWGPAAPRSYCGNPTTAGG